MEHCLLTYIPEPKGTSASEGLASAWDDMRC